MLAALEGSRRNPNIVYSYNERYNSKESENYKRLLKGKVSKIQGFMLHIKNPNTSKTKYETRMSRGASTRKMVNRGASTRKMTMPVTVQSPNQVSSFPATRIGIENNGQVPQAVATAVSLASRNLLRMMQGRGASTSGEKRAAKLQKQASSLFNRSKKDSDRSLMSSTDDEFTIPSSENPATLFMSRISEALSSSSDDSRRRKNKVRVSKSRPLQHPMNNGDQLDRAGCRNIPTAGIIRDAHRSRRQPSEAKLAIPGVESSLQTRQAFKERAQRSSSKGRRLSTLQSEEENTANRMPNSDATTRRKYVNRFAGNGVVPVIQISAEPQRRASTCTVAPVISVPAEPIRRASISVHKKDTAPVIQVLDLPVDSIRPTRISGNSTDTVVPVIPEPAEPIRRASISVHKKDTAPVIQVHLPVDSIRPTRISVNSTDTVVPVIPEPAEPIRRASISVHKKDTAPVIQVSALPAASESIRRIEGGRCSMGYSASVTQMSAEPIRRASISVHKKDTAPVIQVSALPAASDNGIRRIVNKRGSMDTIVNKRGSMDTSEPVIPMPVEPIRIPRHRKKGSMDTCCEPGLDADDYRVGATNSNVESCVQRTAAAVTSRPFQFNVHAPIAILRPTTEDHHLSRQSGGETRRKINSQIRSLSENMHNHGQLSIKVPAYRTSTAQQDFTSTRRLSDPAHRLRPIMERSNIQERGHSNRELQRSIPRRSQLRTGITAHMPLKLDPSGTWKAVSDMVRNASIYGQRENHHRGQIYQSDKTVLVVNTSASKTDAIYKGTQQNQDSIYVDSSIGVNQRRRPRGLNSEVMIDALSNNVSTRF